MTRFIIGFICLILLNHVTFAQTGRPLTKAEFLEFHQKLYNVQRRMDNLQHASEEDDDELAAQCNTYRGIIKKHLSKLEGKDLRKDNNIILKINTWTQTYHRVQCDVDQLDAILENSRIFMN